MLEEPSNGFAGWKATANQWGAVPDERFRRLLVPSPDLRGCHLLGRSTGQRQRCRDGWL